MPFPKKYQTLLDYKRILKETPNKKNLKVTLEKTKNKGVGLFATKTIKKNEVIAYYKCTVFRKKDYESPTDFMYSFEIYKKNGDDYKRLVGDIDFNSFPKPVNNIPFWAPFVNEPSEKQKINAEVDDNTAYNYKNKTFSKPGESMIYLLVATKTIKPGNEITWYYGPDYERDYKVNKN